MVKKRIFDLCLACVGILLTGWMVMVLYMVCSLDTRSHGFFLQWRVGRFGTPFRIIKFKTMRDGSSGKRVTRFGGFLRKTKLDELPQLFNVLKGDMSLVGPRPDVPGYYDLLEGDDRKLLQLRPGITGPASLKYRHEEALLAAQPDALAYNDAVLFPDKVRINRHYMDHWSLGLDIKILLGTFFGRSPHNLLTLGL